MNGLLEMLNWKSLWMWNDSGVSHLIIATSQSAVWIKHVGVIQLYNDKQILFEGGGVCQMLDAKWC